MSIMDINCIKERASGDDYVDVRFLRQIILMGKAEIEMKRKRKNAKRRGREERMKFLPPGKVFFASALI